MCRTGDDCEWYIDSKDIEAVSEIERKCEDCYRTIEPGEIHTLYWAMPGEDFDGDRYFWVAQDPALCIHRESLGRKWNNWNALALYHVIQEDDSDVWEALGFEIFEEEIDLPPVAHTQCTHCRLAAKWLTVICNQDVVMVTREDLNEHWAEYDLETLGEDFRMLKDSCNNKWRRSMGIRMLTPEWVIDHTDRAIAHAISKGLQETAHA